MSSGINEKIKQFRKSSQNTLSGLVFQSSIESSSGPKCSGHELNEFQIYVGTNEKDKIPSNYPKGHKA